MKKMIKKISLLEGGMMFFLASHECQMEQAASSILALFAFTFDPSFYQSSPPAPLLPERGDSLSR
jgi:hypothetical protein